MGVSTVSTTATTVSRPDGMSAICMEASRLSSRVKERSESAVMRERPLRVLTEGVDRPLLK